MSWFSGVVSYVGSLCFPGGNAARRSCQSHGQIGLEAGNLLQGIFPEIWGKLVDEIYSNSRFICLQILVKNMTTPWMMADFFSFANGVGSMRRLYIYLYIWLIFMANIGKYMTHESYGYGTYIYIVYTMDRDWDFIMGSWWKLDGKSIPEIL